MKILCNLVHVLILTRNNNPFKSKRNIGFSKLYKQLLEFYTENQGKFKTENENIFSNKIEERPVKEFNKASF